MKIDTGNKGVEELLFKFHNYLMEEFNGNASEEAIVLFLEKLEQQTQT